MSKSIYDGLYKHIPQNVFKTHWSPLAFYAEDYINTYITRLKCFDLHWDSGLPIAKVMINLDRLESTYGTELDAEFRPRLDAQLGKIKDKVRGRQGLCLICLKEGKDGLQCTQAHH